MTLQMKKYNNTKTIIAVSNKSAILVYVVSALMISTAAVYFIVASQDYSELSQSASSSDNTTTTPESKGQGHIIATVNEMVFFIIVGVAYIAAGIWMLENKYYSKIPYIIAIIGSIALIAFYISTRTMNIPSIGSTRWYRYNRYTFQGHASSYSWCIDIHCQDFNNNMEKCYNNKNIIISSRNIRISRAKNTRERRKAIKLRKNWTFLATNK